MWTGGKVEMTKFERLANRLEKMFGVKPTNFQRTYAGINMKRGGAFTWEAKLGMLTIGSCYSVTVLLKSKNIIQQRSGWDEIELFPED